MAYTYGDPGAAGNGADRVVLMTAQGGTLQRAYGSLGEVVKEIRVPAQDSVAGPNPVFTTLFSYDTWNRIQNLTYADGEVVSFSYDSGGNIKAIAGQKQANAYPYLTFIGYDKFEARERVALGNGTATNYSYNPLNRRLTGLLAQTKSARTFMNMSYGYDAAGNIKTLANAAAVPTAVTKGGATSYSFGYDDLYQLTSATGAFAKPSQATQKFTLSMAGACPRASVARPGERHPQHHPQDPDRVPGALQRLDHAQRGAHLRLPLRLRRRAAARGKPGGQPRLPLRPRRQPGRLERHRQLPEPPHGVG